MEMSSGYKFSLGQRVVARNSSHAGETGIVVSRRPGFGTPDYTVHFGQGWCLCLKEEQMLLLERSGLHRELRSRKYYEKPCEARRRAELRKRSVARKAQAPDGAR